MASQYCDIVPQHIKDEYGEVLGQKIMRYFPDTIPTIEQAAPLAEKLKNRQGVISLAPYAKFKTQSEIEAEVDKRNAEVLEEKVVTETGEELYQLKNGKILKNRPSQLAKAPYKKGKTKAQVDSLEASPNNQVFARLGTQGHALAENLVVAIASQSPLVKIKSPITNPQIGKPDNFSEEAYNEIVRSIDLKVQKIIQKQQTINDRTGKQGQVILYPEVFVHDNKNIGGTMDLLTIYSNGRVDFSDYKFMLQQKELMLSEEGVPTYQPSTEISDIKRKTYRIQTSLYRDIAIDSYGIQLEQFDEISIIPFMMDIPVDPILAEDGTRLRDKKPGEFKAPKYLEQIRGLVGISSEQIKELPTGYQLTDNGYLNAIIVQLDAKLEKAIENARKSYYSESDLKFSQYQDEVSKLERIIEHIQREKNLNSVLEYVLNMTDYINKNSHKIEANDLPYYLDEINYFKNLLESVTKLVNQEEENALANGEIKANELKDALKTNSFKTGLSLQLLNQSHVILRDRLEMDLEKLNPDIAEISSYNFGEKLIPWSEIEEPVIQSAFKLFNEAETKKYKAIRSLQDKIKEEMDALKKAGYTTEQANRLIFDERTGNVISKFDSEKRSALFEARDNNDVRYIKSMYKYSDEGKKRYNEDLAKRRERLAAIHGQDTTAYKKALSKFIDENNLARSENAWLIPATLNKYAELKDVEENYNPAYTNLPAPIKRYVDFYYETMNSFNSILPNEYIRENFVPNIQAQSASMLRQLLAVRAPKDIWNLIKRHTVDGLRIRQSEMTTLTMNINDPDLRVPLPYKDNFEYYDRDMHEYRASFTRDQNNFAKNKDLMYNLIMFGEAVYHKAYMDETLSTMQSLMIYAKDKQSYQQDLTGRLRGTKTRTRQPLLESSDRISKNLNQLIRTHVLRESTTSQDYIFNAFGAKNVSLNKAVSSLINVSRTIALGFNYKAALAGFMTGQANLLAFSRKGRQFDRKQLMSAYRNMTSPNARAMSEYFAIEKENHTQRIARETSKNILNKVLNRDTMYIFYRPEELTSNIILGSMARNYGVDPADGQVKRLKDIKSDVPSVLDMWKEATDSGKDIKNMPLTDEQFAQFRTMVRATSRRIKGTGMSNDKSTLNGNLLYKTTMIFRTWLTPMLMNIYGGARYNKAMDDFEIGVTRVLIGEVANIFKTSERNAATGFLSLAANSIPFFGQKLSKLIGLEYKVSKEASLDSYQKFVELNPLYGSRISEEQWHQLRQDSMNQQLSYIRILASLSLLLMVLGGDFDEDGERDSKKIGALNLGHQLLDRFQTEMLFFYDYDAMREITQSPIPLLGFLQLYANTGFNTFDEARDYVFGENKLTKTGKSADKAEQWHYSKRFVPFIYQWGNLVETLNLQQEELEE